MTVYLHLELHSLSCTHIVDTDIHIHIVMSANIWSQQLQIKSSLGTRRYNILDTMATAIFMILVCNWVTFYSFSTFKMLKLGPTLSIYVA